MYKGKRIAVIVPAYNEARVIDKVLTTIPLFVDRIYAIDDASVDDTFEIAFDIASKDSRVTVIHRDKNGGVGAAIITGYREAFRDNIDVVAIMGGDGQMDPSILHNILDPVVESKADYAKGDRLSIAHHKREMSAWRAFGNVLLTHLTRIASGYRHISDPQNGYTAISMQTLRKLDVDKIRKDFAFENDLLVKLSVVEARVLDIQHPAVYSGNGSKIKYPRFIVQTSWLLLKDFLWRLWVKYIKHHFLKVSKY